MKILDLFSGIGGFSLAGHWAGFETVAFIERDKFCHKVLQKNFPGIPIYDDIIQFDGKEYQGAADIVCGGFPCQPFSTAGKRKGAEDSRHLWPEMLRVISEVRPKWAIGENVAGILTMDGGNLFESICLDLEAEGYEVQPYVIPAISLGAPHRRDRVWIVAQVRTTANSTSKQNITTDKRWVQQKFSLRDSKYTANGDGAGLQREFCGQFRGVSETNGTQQGRSTDGTFTAGEQWRTHWHEVATRLCRVDDGLSGRVDRHRAARLKALGNSIVPQIAYQIFEAIKAER